MSARSVLLILAAVVCVIVAVVVAVFTFGAGAGAVVGAVIAAAAMIGAAFSSASQADPLPGMLLGASIGGVKPSVPPPAGVRIFQTGMVGLAAKQTARVNVVNAGPPDSLAWPAYVQGWKNPHSEPLAESTTTLQPGSSTFLDFARASIEPDDDRRVQIRAVVTAFADAQSACIVTLEVIDDASGKTTACMRVPEVRAGG